MRRNLKYVERTFETAENSRFTLICDVTLLGSRLIFMFHDVMFDETQQPTKNKCCRYANTSVYIS